MEDKPVITFDLEELELRLLAISQDAGDCHKQVASEVFNIEPDAVTPEQRRAAKAINYGIMYGIAKPEK